MNIHREGRKILSILLIVLIIINAGLHYLVESEVVLNLVLGSSIVFYILVLQFFRNPVFKLPQEDGLVYAPADGKVVVIEKTDEPEYLKEERIQVSIFMSPLNVHVNRAPVGGEVKFFKYHPGKYLVAWHPKSSTENERTTMVIGMKSGLEILVRQVAGAVARRIKWYVDEGKNIKPGEEFGFIKFGSRLDIYVPTDALLKVNIGDKTKAGRTVIAALKK